MIIKYIIGLIIGSIMITPLSILVTVLRFGIPECNARLKKETDNLTILALKELKRKYKISILIWLLIILLVSVGCCFWLKSAFVGYLLVWIISLYSIIKDSKRNFNNLYEFEKSLKANISFIVDKEAIK